jgi:hypothetical protein
MNRDVTEAKLFASSLFAVIALVGFAAVGCSEINPESNVEEAAVLDAPTEEADSLRRMEERRKQSRGDGGGGSY